MNRFSLLIGLENYAENIDSVRYAENDATEFKDCLIELGLDERDISCLLSSYATKTKIEAELRRIASLANKDDEIIFFFAGHGVSINSSNYITCYDTVPSDIINTCISLKWIFDLFKSSASQRKIFFLDSCHSGMNIDESMRGIFDTMNESEIKEFFENSEYEVGFASCNSSQFSYSSPNLRHGIWTFHLLKALRGSAPNAVEKNKYITSSSLQNYLSKEVPNTLKTENPNPVSQTPICFGSFSNEFQIFNLEPILNKREAERKAKIKGLKSVDLIGSRGGAIKELSGFRKKSHFVPDTVDSYTKGFVERIAAENVEEETTFIYSQLKKIFGYKRKEITTDIEGSSSVIATKDFDISIFYTQHPEEPGSYIIEYQITNIRDSDKLFNDQLQEILNRHFDKVNFTVSGSINIVEIIDLIEEVEPDDIFLDYPPDYSYLNIQFEDNNWILQIQSDGISIVSNYLESPSKMLNYLNESKILITDYSPLHKLLT